MERIILASSNPGKLAEIEQCFASIPLELIAQSTLNISDAAETAVTFIENALIKARHASSVSGLPAIADDSGLCVNALAGAPGVYSARYAGSQATDQMRNDKLLQELQQATNPDRRASYHSVMVFLLNANDPAPLICHGTWHGEIINTPRGSGGFGYDPLFYLPALRLTAAELTTQQKNAISHRGQAMDQMLRALQHLIQLNSQTV